MTTDVLLVEDNAADVYVIQRVMADAKKEARLSVVPDGPQALAFLRKAQPFQSVPTPRLILVDLGLPTMHGTELLPQIRQLPGYAATPLVVFSANPSEQEAARCRALGADAYVQKQLDFSAFADAVKTLVQRWLQ